MYLLNIFFIKFWNWKSLLSLSLSLSVTLSECYTVCVEDFEEKLWNRLTAEFLFFTMCVCVVLSLSFSHTHFSFSLLFYITLNTYSSSYHSKSLFSLSLSLCCCDDMLTHTYHLLDHLSDILSIFFFGVRVDCIGWSLRKWAACFNHNFHPQKS